MYEWVLRFHLPQKVRSIDLRHIVVADNDRWRCFQNGLEGLLGVVRAFDDPFVLLSS